MSKCSKPIKFVRGDSKKFTISLKVTNSDGVSIPWIFPDGDEDIDDIVLSIPALAGGFQTLTLKGEDASITIDDRPSARLLVNISSEVSELLKSFEDPLTFQVAVKQTLDSVEQTKYFIFEEALLVVEPVSEIDFDV